MNTLISTNDFEDNGIKLTPVEGNTSTHEYLYDGNGNMIQDKNKNITVTYNYMNLPTVVDFGNNNKIVWTYSVSGAKLRKAVYTNNSITMVQDYVSGFVYKNSQLDFFGMEEGRVKKLANGTLQYQYTINDHLGNTRVMFADVDNNGTIDPNTEILQEDHYYAFGLRIEGLSSSNKDNKFTYNGKELEDDHGLNWYHYGARYYDPALGRWHAVDPVDELYSPFCYVTNNPLKFIDPDGTHIDGTEDDMNWTAAQINQGLKDKKIDNYKAVVSTRERVRDDIIGKLSIFLFNKPLLETVHTIVYEGKGPIQAKDPNLNAEENMMATESFIWLKEIIDSPDYVNVKTSSADNPIIHHNNKQFNVAQGHGGGFRYDKNNVFIDRRGNQNEYSLRYGEKPLGIFFHEMVGHGHPHAEDANWYNRIYNYENFEPHRKY